MTDRDDRLLQEQLDSYARKNAEVDGDKDSEGEEDTGMGEVDVEGAIGIVE